MSQRITKRAINEALKPLTHALYHTPCKTAPVIEAFGLKLYGQRLYNAPGCRGPAWNACCGIVGASNSGAGGIPGSGDREQFTEQLYRYLNR